MGQRQKKYTLLVVDDDNVYREMMCRVLSRHGFHTLSAPNGLKLAGYLRINKPDLILLDISMSWIDGYELCRLIRKMPDFTKVPIIFVSALTSPENIQRGYECGGDDYLCKPFNIDTLVSRVKHLLGIAEEIINA